MVTVKLGTKTEEKPFPKLMKAKGVYSTIVLFHEEAKGVCVWSDCPFNKTGTYSDGWVYTDFTDYNEPVILQNA